MNLTDAQLCRLVMSDPRDSTALRELRLRTCTRLLLLRSLPSPTGHCPHGHRVYADGKGAYSSGYVLHVRDHKPCDRFKEVTWDPEGPAYRRVNRLVKALSDPWDAAGFCDELHSVALDAAAGRL